MKIHKPFELKMLQLKQVMERTRLSRSTIYGKLDPKSPQYDPDFPTQVRLGNGAVRWVEAELNAWLVKRIRLSRAGGTSAIYGVNAMSATERH